MNVISVIWYYKPVWNSRGVCFFLISVEFYCLSFF